MRKLLSGLVGLVLGACAEIGVPTASLQCNEKNPSGQCVYRVQIGENYCWDASSSKPGENGEHIISYQVCFDFIDPEGLSTMDKSGLPQENIDRGNCVENSTYISRYSEYELSPADPLVCSTLVPNPTYKGQIPPITIVPSRLIVTNRYRKKDTEPFINVLLFSATKE